MSLEKASDFEKAVSTGLERTNERLIWICGKWLRR